MQHRSRLAVALLTIGLAAGGLATGQRVLAAPSAPTRSATLAAALECRSIDQGIDFAASVQVAADLPTSVVPGGTFTFRPAVTVTSDFAGSATPVDIRLFANTHVEGGSITIPLPTNGSRSFALTAGVTGPVTLSFTVPSTLTMHLPATGSDVECFTTTVTGDLSVPVVAPTDGSQQAYDLSATASCTDESHTFSHVFGMRGIAPSSVAPGETAAITFDWTGLASMLQETATVVATGRAGSPERLTFIAVNGSKGIQLTTGPAATSGEIRFQLDQVDSALQALNPPHVNSAHCTFPEGGPVITVPISTTPITVSTTSTTTTASTSTSTSTTSSTVPSTTIPTTTTSGLTTTTAAPATTTTAPATTTTAAAPPNLVLFVRILRFLICLFFGVC